MENKLLEKLLMPFARFCVRRSIKLQNFLPTFKKCLIQAASEELNKINVKKTSSKIQAMTGVHRKDLKEFNEEEKIQAVKLNPIIRIIGQWQTHPEFTTKGGKPKILNISGADSEFKKLVDSVHCDENHYALLFELERNKLIEKTKTGIKLIVKHYLSIDKKKDAISFLAEELDDLIFCVEKNTFEDTEKHLQLKTSFDNIPAKHIPELKSWLVEEGSKFHSKVRIHFSRFDCDTNPNIKNEDRRMKITLSSFSITDEVAKG